MADFDKIKAEASGRWLSIFRGLGIYLREDGRHGPCPSCGGEDRFRLDRDSAERGSYYCSQCGPGDGISLIRKVLGVDFKEAMAAVGGVVGGCDKNVVPKETKMTKEKLRSMFDGGSRAASGDMVGSYLQGRGLSTVPSALWCLPKCWEPETKKNHNAMVGIFSAPDSEVCCVHRTYIDAAGKLDLESPKKLTPTCRPMIGGAIRLFEPVNGLIAVAEGIETAIAVQEYMGVPCWSVVSSEIMKGFEPPEGITDVVVCGDNDQNFAGQAAAFILGQRLSAKGYGVTVMIPDKPGHDYLDEYVSIK